MHFQMEIYTSKNAKIQTKSLRVEIRVTDILRRDLKREPAPCLMGMYAVSVEH